MDWEWVSDFWLYVAAQQPDWDLILRFLDILIWPFVVLTGVLMIRPGRLIDSILENGGEIAAAGTAIRLGRRIEQVAEAVRSDLETPPTAEPPATNPLEETADPYTTIMNGWGLVTKGLEEAVERTGIEPLDRRMPMHTVNLLRKADWIGTRLEQNIQELWNVRNQVRGAGSRRLKRLGLDRARADQYYALADRVQKGITNAISYRKRRDANSSVAPGSAPLPSSGPDIGPLN